MKNQRSQTKLITLLTALAFLFASQGCSKDDDPSALGGAKISQNTDTAAPTSCPTVCLVAGKTMYVGEVGASMAANGDLLVTYNVTKPGVFLLETHLDVFTSEAQLAADGKVKNGNVAPGQFSFKRSFSLADKQQVYTVTVTKAQLEKAVGAETNCFFVATHAALSNNETAWGGLCTGNSPTGTTSLGTPLQFSGRNWGVYFEFCKTSCTQAPVAFTYAWEDSNENGDGNDRDYNDLVIQSSVTLSPNNLRMNFIASARGASFDHKFSIKIPKANITGIFGGSAIEAAPDYTEDGTYYYITIFESTKLALPSTGPFGFANTIASAGCVPVAQKAIVLQTTNGSNFSAMGYMFEPFITVTAFSYLPKYDLYIHEVSMAKANGRNDTWVASDGQRYPNGILIPANWKWPLEKMPITGPYPDFRSLTAGFNSSWPTTPAANYLDMTSVCN